MSKGFSKRDDYVSKKQEHSRHHFTKRIEHREEQRSHGSQNSSEGLSDKRPSVFDRLGGKGDGNNGNSRPGRCPADKSSKIRKCQSVDKVGREAVQKRRGGSKTKKFRKASPRSSEGTSTGSSSSSRSSSTSGTSSSSSVETTSSSSAPSVKLRQKKQKKEAGKEQQRAQRPDEQPMRRKEKPQPPRDNVNIEKRNLDRPSSARQEPNRPDSAVRKRKTSCDSFPEDRKQTRYDSPPLRTQWKPSPRRNSPTPEPYRRVRDREVNNEPIRERIRIVPPSLGGRAEGQGRFIGTSKPKPRPENRNYPDFSSGEEPRVRERLAPARTPPSRERIPPLLPDRERKDLNRRPFNNYEPTHKSFVFPRRPLLPSPVPETLVIRSFPPVVREFVGIAVAPPPRAPPKPLFEKSEVVVKSTVESLVGGGLSPPLKKTPPEPLEDEEILSEISEDEEDELSAVLPEKEEKEEEVSSTLDGVRGLESQTEDSILENMDFEEISEDELDEGSSSPGKKIGIVDALGVDWSILVRGREDSNFSKEVRRRETTLVDILKRTGLRKGLVKESLFNQILERVAETEGLDEGACAEELTNPCLRKRRLERESFVEKLGLGQGSRALSARRDMALRRHLLGLEPLPLVYLNCSP